MRHWPLIAVPSLLAACASAPTPAPAPAAPAPVEAAPAVLAPATPGPTPTPTPTPTPSPTPSPSPSAASPSASPSGLAEANHGPSPFPSPMGAGAYNLAKAKATAGAGGATAIGAIDGRLYTQWAARTGVGQNTWLSIDLGAAEPVSKVELLADASPTTEVSFDVEVSTDGETWKTVARSVLGTGSNEAPKWATGRWAQESARYVRVVPTRWGASWVAVWEMRVYP